MVNSMTGYGRAEEVLHGRSLSVEIRSVNSRYFEYNSRIPRSVNFLDDTLRKLLSSKISRGKVELGLSLQNLEGGGTEVLPNFPVARGYHTSLTGIARELGIHNDVTASVIGRFSDVFTVTKSEMDEEELQADVLAVAEAALERFTRMRAVEGKKLREDIEQRLEAIRRMVEQVEADSAGRVERYRERLLERLREVLVDSTVDESRILTEAAIFADKTAVEEETVRLRSHLEQYAAILEKGGQAGRKLDFLTQELNREVNTIGSKCQEIEITRVVVDMKSEIEKIREQIQNLE